MKNTTKKQTSQNNNNAAAKNTHANTRQENKKKAEISQRKTPTRTGKREKNANKTKISNYK